MTTTQISNLLGTHGLEKLAIVVFGDGKRVAITKEMIDDNLIIFDDSNEIITFKEPDFIFDCVMSHRTRYVISNFEYASIIGLIFVQDEEDMYENNKKSFMIRNPRLEEDNETKYEQ